MINSMAQIQCYEEEEGSNLLGELVLGIKKRAIGHEECLLKIKGAELEEERAFFKFFLKNVNR